MIRISLILLSLFLAACESRIVEQSPDNRLLALADKYYADYLLMYPNIATILDLPNSRHDRLPDNSIKALAVWRAKEDLLYQELLALKKYETKIKDVGTLGLLEHMLSSSIERRVCKEELWRFSYWDSWVGRLVYISMMQSVETKEQQDIVIERFSNYHNYMLTEIENMRAGLKAGLSSSKRMVERLLETLDTQYLSENEDDSYLFHLSRISKDEAFSQRWEEFTRKSIIPSLKVYYNFLKEEYLPQARDSVGLSGLPDNMGHACYLAIINDSSSLSISIEEIKKLGSAFDKKIQPTQKLLMKKYFNTEDYHELIEITKKPKYNFESYDDALNHLNHLLKRASAASDEWFNKQPNLELIGKINKTSGSAHYNIGTVDGRIPSIVSIDISDPAKYRKHRMARSVVHEGGPGHHMQLGLTQQMQNAHPLNKILEVDAFAEGWAKYVEIFAQEMGFYQGEEEFWFYNSVSKSYLKVLVDIGINYEGWTREKAISFQVENGTSQKSAANMADRVTAMPSQIMTYMIGSLKILELRNAAQMKLGEKFDLKEFHDVVLENGAIPLNTLTMIVKSYIEQKK